MSHFCHVISVYVMKSVVNQKFMYLIIIKKIIKKLQACFHCQNNSNYVYVKKKWSFLLVCKCTMPLSNVNDQIMSEILHFIWFINIEKRRMVIVVQYIGVTYTSDIIIMFLRKHLCTICLTRNCSLWLIWKEGGGGGRFTRERLARGMKQNTPYSMYFA